MRTRKPKWIFTATSNYLEIFENVTNQKRLNHLNRMCRKEHDRRSDVNWRKLIANIDNDFPRDYLKVSIQPIN